MRFTCENRQSLGREFVLLAPGHTPAQFGRILGDTSQHQRLLAGAQKLRGRIYVEDGAIEADQLSSDGRHIQAADDLSWHLLAVEPGEKVVACLRYFAHAPHVTFSELTVSQSALARSPELGAQVREAVETELEYAARRGLSYVEIGGWAISEELRCTSEALQMLLSVYALGQLTGGALGLSTATTRHHSSSILKRVGGRPLVSRSEQIPPYYDPDYDCEMELLRFDSSTPSTKYSNGIGQCRSALRQVPVVSLLPITMPAVSPLVPALLPLSAIHRQSAVTAA